MFNYSLPKCTDDKTVHNAYHRNGRYLCPEHEQRPLWTEVSGPARNDTKILLRDPRDGPHLPFACIGMETWNVSGNELPKHDEHSFLWQKNPGSPLYEENCSSAKQCWQDVFLKRFHARPNPGEARLLSFIKLFHLGGKEIKGKSRTEILAGKHTYFYHWLKLAGVADLE